MRNLNLILCVIGVAHAEPTFFRPDGWKLGTAFPEAPQVSEHVTKTARGDVVESRAAYMTKEFLFAIERVRYPVSIPDEKRDAAYEGAKRGILRQREILKSEEKIVICGHDGRRYRLEHNDGSRLTEQWLVIVGDELYQFIYSYVVSSGGSPASSAFFSKIDESKG